MPPPPRTNLRREPSTSKLCPYEPGGTEQCASATVRPALTTGKVLTPTVRPGDATGATVRPALGWYVDGVGAIGTHLVVQHGTESC